MARQAELLQLRTMLSSVTFDSGDLAIDLDGSDSASAQVTSENKVQVSINGAPVDEMPDASTIYSITVTAGDGGHFIDLSGLQPVHFAYLPVFATITTGPGDDTVTGTGMMDTIDVGSGNDVVDGNGGDDHITGGLGEDTLSGGDGWDVIFDGDTGVDQTDESIEQTPTGDSLPGDTGESGDDSPEEDSPGGGLWLDLTIDSNNDGFVDGFDDYDEDQAPGHTLAFNNDDNNGNGMADYLESATVDNENDLSEMLLSVTSTEIDLTGYQMRLEYSAASEMKVWTTHDKSGLLVSGSTWTLDAIGNGAPASVWVEGIDAGHKTATLKLIDTAGTRVLEDQVQLTTYRIVNVTYASPPDSGQQLDKKNPDGSKAISDTTKIDGETGKDQPAFLGGWRIFPGANSYTDDPATPTDETATNNHLIVAVKITPKVAPNGRPVSVYLKTFDVDDPTADTTVDTNGNDGADNRGIATGMNRTVPATSPGWPGALKKTARVTTIELLQQTGTKATTTEPRFRI